MDDIFSRLSSIYGMNHFDIDFPFRMVLKHFGVDESNLSELGSYAGSELYEVAEYIDKVARPKLVTWSIDGERVDRVWLDPSQRNAIERLLKHFGVNRGPYQRGDWFHYFSSIYLIGDPGIGCILTVTNQTAFAIYKYGGEEVKRFLAGLIGDGKVRYGATWFTEIQGGSDLGQNLVEAVKLEEGWRLNGDTKYFSSNAGLANYALVTARPRGARSGAKGLALFLVPEFDSMGRRNFSVRRLKEKSGTVSVPTGEVEFHDSEAYLLGEKENGIYYTMENLMVSRLSNAVAALGISRKAFLEAYFYSKKRKVFGKPMIEHALVLRDLLEMEVYIEGTMALTFKAIKEFQNSYMDMPPYTDAYNYARMLTHISKNLTADMAAHVTKMSMELHGGIGFLSEFPVERWHREALITPIWEGPSNIQALDMLEVMAKKGAHHTLLKDLVATGEEIEQAKSLYEFARKRIEEQVEKIGGLSSEDSQFHAKDALNMIGHSVAVIQLLHISSRLKAERFAKVASLYAHKFIRNEPFGAEWMKEARNIIEVDKVEKVAA